MCWENWELYLGKNWGFLGEIRSSREHLEISWGMRTSREELEIPLGNKELLRTTWGSLENWGALGNEGFAGRKRQGSRYIHLSPGTQRSC